MRLVGMFAGIIVVFTATISVAEDAELGKLIKQLDSQSMEEKAKAARELGEIGPAAFTAVPSLIKSLSTDNLELQHEAIAALGKISSDPRNTVPALNRLLSNNSPIIRYTAITSIRQFGPDAAESLPQLKKNLNDSELLISVGAARAIIQIDAGRSSDVQQLISKLIEGLKSEHQEIASEAQGGLSLLGASTVPAIQELISPKHARVSINACDTLAALGPDASRAIDRLLLAVRSADPELRFHALTAIGAIGPEAKSAVPLLIEDLKNADPAIKFAAGQALRRIGKPAIAALKASLNDEHARTASLEALSEFGPEAAEAASLISGFLTSPDAKVRREAILAIAAIGPAGKETTPDLIRALEDTKFAYRPSAAYALGKVGAKDAVPNLKKSLEDQENPVLSLASAWALVQLDPGNDDYAKIAVPKLGAALSAENPLVREEAARTLGQLRGKSKSTVGALRKALNDPAPQVRRAALIALAEIGPDSAEAIPDITTILKQGDPALRSIACFALANIGSSADQAVPLLTRLLSSREPHQRTVAAWALLKISKGRKSADAAIPLLADALKHAANPAVRVEAVKALSAHTKESTVASDAIKAALQDPEEVVRKAAESASTPQK